MKILAVDFGESRTGLAVCDELEFMASPAGVLFEKNTEKTIAKIVAAVAEHKAQEVVVGLPKNMDGTKGERAQRCEYVAQRLREEMDVPVVMWDERATTKTALSMLDSTGTYGKKRRQVLDAVAATVILESYLAFRKNNPGAVPGDG